MDQMKAAQQRHEDLLQYKRETGKGGAKKSASGEHYNILTLDYKPTPEGQRLKMKASMGFYPLFTFENWNSSLLPPLT